MGQAKLRGTREQRVLAAQERDDAWLRAREEKRREQLREEEAERQAIIEFEENFIGPRNEAPRRRSSLVRPRSLSILTSALAIAAGSQILRSI